MTALPARPLVIVQNNWVLYLTAPLALAARERGVDMRDISSGSDGVPADILEGGPWSPIFVMGSVRFAQMAATSKTPLSDWIFWTDTNYDPAVWTAMLGDSYINSGGAAMRLHDFLALEADAKHVRPRSAVKIIVAKERSHSAAGQRSLAGLVIKPDQMAQLEPDPEIPVWVSPVREINAEIRCWMIAGRVAAASTYRINGELLLQREHPLIDEGCKLAVALHRRWHPDRHYVVDLAKTPLGWKVVEYNPMHSCGWYDVDAGTVLDAFLSSYDGC